MLSTWLGFALRHSIWPITVSKKLHSWMHDIKLHMEAYASSDSFKHVNSATDRSPEQSEIDKSGKGVQARRKHLYTSNFSRYRLASSTASSTPATLVPVPMLVGSLPKALPPTAAATRVVHSDAEAPRLVRGCICGGGGISIVMLGCVARCLLCGVGVGNGRGRLASPM